MKIEEFKNITIAYMRNIGEYGPKNKELMDSFKGYLRANKLFSDKTVILGIALDNPEVVSKNELRYDVGIVVDEIDKKVFDLNTRQIADGKYAIFEIPHTAQEVQKFWSSIPQIAAKLSIDYKKVIIERYTMDKVDHNLCEFCIPLK